MHVILCVDCGGVSIHASREGRDFIGQGWTTAVEKFQSTRPVKDATIQGQQTATALKFQSTRP